MRRDALLKKGRHRVAKILAHRTRRQVEPATIDHQQMLARRQIVEQGHAGGAAVECNDVVRQFMARLQALDHMHPDALVLEQDVADAQRSEEHTSELQSLMRISYAVLCFQNKKT